MSSNWIKIVSTLFAVTLLVQSERNNTQKLNQYISFCDYYGGKYVGESELVFICTELKYKTNFFEQYSKVVCRNQYLCHDDCEDGFYRFMVGTIRFKNCELHEIPMDLFTVYDDVHEFDMSCLGIRTLQSNSFNEAKYLSRLNASRNQITDIPANLFNQSEKIINLDLSFNQITHFDTETFPDENKLEILNLSGNNISKLSVHTFRKLINLKHLRLSKNRIAEIPSFLFNKTGNLIEIDLSYNQIQTINNFVFSNDLNLKRIKLSHNQLSSLHHEFFILSNLTYLDISWNKFTVLMAEFFENHRQLKYLDVSGNSIEWLDNDTFNQLQKLQHLNLSYNSLTTIAPSLFSSLINLQTLDLSNNKLRIMDAACLPFYHPFQIYQLHWISIANNQITELPNFTSERIPNTRIAGIDRNQFNCSYYDVILHSFAWEQIESISELMNCSSAHGVTESTFDLNNLKISTIDANDQHLQTTENIQPSSFQSEDMANKTYVTFDQNQNETVHSELNTVSNENIDLILLKKYFIVLICVMITGFIIITMFFICMTLRMGVCDSQTPQNPTNNKINNNISAESTNSFNNHIYDMIEKNSN